MTNTPRKKALLDAAAAAGYTIETGPGDHPWYKIFKLGGRWGKVVQGIELFDSGTAFDLMVGDGMARGTRSYNDMREVLGLSPEEG